MQVPRSDTAPTALLRVLHVASGDLWAGAEVQIVHLLKALDTQGGIALRVVLMNEGMMANKLRQGGITVDVFDEGKHGMRQLLTMLRGIVRTWQPTVIHTHRRKEHLLGALAARGSGARLVATCHGRSEDLPGRQSLRNRALAALQWTLLRRAHDRVVAVSDELAGHLPLPAARIEVICNGIDPDEIRSAALLATAPLPGHRPVKIGFVGRLVPVKQVDRLIRAMQILEREAPGHFVLYLLGDGPLRSELERVVSELGLEDTVLFLGFRADALPLIAALDVVAFSSRHEGLPMAALEALALGAPVVGPPVGGLQDLLSLSPLGVLSASDTPAALAEALRQAMSPVLDSLRGRPGIPEKYLLSNCAQKYRRLYRSLKSSTHSSSAVRSVT